MVLSGITSEIITYNETIISLIMAVYSEENKPVPSILPFGTPVSQMCS